MLSPQGTEFFHNQLSFEEAPKLQMRAELSQSLDFTLVRSWAESPATPSLNFGIQNWELKTGCCLTSLRLWYVLVQQQRTGNTHQSYPPHSHLPHSSQHILSLFTANTIASQQRSKWPPPPLHSYKEQGNLTLRGYLDQGRPTSAGCAGDGGHAAGVAGAEPGQGAELAGSVVRMARCCGESDTSYCFWLTTQQV